MPLRNPKRTDSLTFSERGIFGQGCVSSFNNSALRDSLLESFSPLVVFDGDIPISIQQLIPSHCGVGKVCRSVADIHSHWEELAGFDFPWFVIDAEFTGALSTDEMCRIILTAASYTDNIEVVFPFHSPLGGPEASVLTEVGFLPVKVVCLRDVTGRFSRTEWAPAFETLFGGIRSSEPIEFGIFPSDAHGLAVANAMEAFHLGVRRFEGSLFRKVGDGFLDLARFTDLLSKRSGE